MDFKLNKLNAFVIVFLLWAGIYLPGLGTLDIDFNEGRRIMPAVGMLDSGNWRVPTLAGEEYFKKPPMINWLIAGSFIAFGEKSEFAARFPAAVAMLAFVSLLVLMSSPFLSIQARMAAAIFFLTCIGCIDSGRQTEIDSIYACVAGMAMMAWLNLWAAQRRSSFTLWFLPSLIMGFGLLLKGPIILLFFYLLVVSVLAYERKLKELFTVHHLLGIFVMLAIFGSWALSIPASGSAKSAGAKMTGTWVSEIVMRFKGEELNIGKWPLRASGAFLNLLPWLVFAPLLFSRTLISRIPENDVRIFKGCRFAILAALIAVNLMPGVKARYSMPVYGLALVMIGWIVLQGSFPKVEKIWKSVILVLAGMLSLACIASFALVVSGGAGMLTVIPKDVVKNIGCAVDSVRSSYFLFGSGALVMIAVAAMFILLVWKRKYIAGNFMLVLSSGVLAVAFSLSTAVFALPVMAQYQKGHEALAGNINQMIKGGTLYAYRTECEPFLFYIRPGVKFIRTDEQIDANVKYVICRTDLLGELDRAGVLAARKTSEISRFKHRRTEYVLFGLD